MHPGNAELPCWNRPASILQHQVYCLIHKYRLASQIAERGDVCWWAMPHTWHDEGRAEGELLVLGEEVVGVLVQHHAAHRLQGEQLLGPDLGHVQGVEVVLVLILHRHCLGQQPKQSAHDCLQQQHTVSAAQDGDCCCKDICLLCPSCNVPAFAAQLSIQVESPESKL